MPQHLLSASKMGNTQKHSNHKLLLRPSSNVKSCKECCMNVCLCCWKIFHSKPNHSTRANTILWQLLNYFKIGTRHKFRISQKISIILVIFLFVRQSTEICTLKYFLRFCMGSLFHPALHVMSQEI